jgi:GT2 family glycosyltransferase
MDKLNTFIICPILPNFTEPFLESVHKLNPPNFQVIIIDQTKDGIYEKVKRFNPEIYLRVYRNVGFSKAMNMGAGLSTTPYITCANDDVEIVNSRWWDGIVETFESDQRIIAVNPNSPKVAMWGYGCDHYTKLEICSKEESKTEAGYDYLLKGNFENLKGKLILDNGEMKPIPESFPLIQTGVCDGIATWFTVFKRDIFNQLGGFDEKYFPGGGEDQEMCARAYSKGMRMVGTMKSWVWHEWSSSRDHPELLPPRRKELDWNNHDEIWPPELNEGAHMDPWGMRTLPDGSKVPLKRVPIVHRINL